MFLLSFSPQERAREAKLVAARHPTAATPYTCNCRRRRRRRLGTKEMLITGGLISSAYSVLLKPFSSKKFQPPVSSFNFQGYEIATQSPSHATHLSPIRSLSLTLVPSILSIEGNYVTIISLSSLSLPLSRLWRSRRPPRPRPLAQEAIIANN